MEMLFSIGSVERDTGLSKDTLRVWEKRYSFPQPIRDALGDRSYSIEQVEKLRLLKRLIDSGYRPSKIINLEVLELRALAEQAEKISTRPAHFEKKRDDLRIYLDACKEHRFDDLRRLLSRELLRLGLYRFISEVIAPLNTIIGTLWATGEIAVYEEHLYTESAQVVIRNAISAVSVLPEEGSVGPKILLTTFPYESHGLGLLMAEAIFALEGAKCISLGTQTPIMDIARAAEKQDADIVALSFSEAMNGNHVVEDLSELRSALPRSCEIWAGGSCSVIHRRPPDGIRVLGLEGIGIALADWRQAQPQSQGRP
ncbi:DNA-binding transcriptional regulator, MerR family [Noviherbaspirillum humi]|uniref:DNA-binding transcriptional regulator, MerR family n=1 Tax=Noviherbaspirillum humi TaxID=1688639 RepID=A0A239M369_9BURK|nr:MerR family transcriptional regulator [Noviherbaspirillum humi]SNT37136.1 DNA-binding transcriptional regulator, MerR family [Noviherbaspirillum humi]